MKLFAFAFLSNIDVNGGSTKRFELFIRMYTSKKPAVQCTVVLVPHVAVSYTGGDTSSMLLKF